MTAARSITTTSAPRSSTRTTEVLAERGRAVRVDLAAQRDDPDASELLDRRRRLHEVRQYGAGAGPAPSDVVAYAAISAGSASSRTTVVSVRVAWKPPQLDQKSIERMRPAAPTIIRMTPTTLMSTPETVAVTAQVRIAPDCDQNQAYGDTHFRLFLS